MLDKTLIVIGTEFGRPPEFDGGGGRGHHPQAFTCVLAGGGLRHCGAFGEVFCFEESFCDETRCFWAYGQNIPTR